MHYDKKKKYLRIAEEGRNLLTRLYVASTENQTGDRESISKSLAIQLYSRSRYTLFILYKVLLVWVQLPTFV